MHRHVCAHVYSTTHAFTLAHTRSSEHHRAQEANLFKSKPPHSQPIPPTFLPPSRLIYRPQDGSLQSMKKPRLPMFPHGFHFLARKVQGWVRCFPFAL